MEVLTQRLGTDTWIPWPNVPRGLLAAVGEPAACVLLYSADPQTEVDELASAVRLIRRSAGRSTHVVVASTRATGSWVDEVRMAGVDQVWTVDRLDRSSPGEVRLRVLPVARVHSIPRRDDADDSDDHTSSPGGRVDDRAAPGERVAAVASR
jgi:hypothetical protein